jgi:hypothetical protein
LYSFLNPIDSPQSRLIESYKVEENDGEDSYLGYSNALGQGPAANSVSHHKMFFGVERLYRKEYNFDQFHQRKVIQTKSKKEGHFILAGGSNVFGQGSNDNETLASQMALLKPNHQFYNLGYRGYGPNHILRFFETFKIKKYVLEEKGKFVFHLFDYSVSRAYGERDVIKWAGGEPPGYELIEDKLVNVGRYKNLGHYQLASQLNKISFFDGRGFGSRYSKEKLRLTALILSEMKKQYLEAFPKGEFIVLISPFYLRITFRKELIKLFKELKIAYIMPTKKVIERFVHPRYYYRHDLHIKPAGHKLLAHYLKYAAFGAPLPGATFLPHDL